MHRLVDEHRATELSYSTVRDYVPVRRSQIDEAGRRVEVFVPQEHLPGAEAKNDNRRIADRICFMGEDFATKQPLFAALPVDPGLMLTPLADRSSLITVRMVKYSVPVRFVGHKVRVSLRGTEVLVFDGRTPIATHLRIAARTGTMPVLVGSVHTVIPVITPPCQSIALSV